MGTHVRGWALICTRAGECDKFMAALVHNKAADCKRENRGGKRKGWEHGRKGRKKPLVVPCEDSMQNNISFYLLDFVGTLM